MQDGPTHRVGAIERGGESLARLDYGSAATIWRINLGWRRRKQKNLFGFLLDTERGYWATNEIANDDDEADPLSSRVTRVIPFVEDRRNCLMLEPTSTLSEAVMASLGAALKTAIQIRFQLEDSELAAEPLPHASQPPRFAFLRIRRGRRGRTTNSSGRSRSDSERRQNGAGDLPFRPDTGDDKRRAPGAKEDCEAACYDCLMSYGNQGDHKLLDRQLIRELLLSLADSRVSASPAHQPRKEHIVELTRLATASWSDAGCGSLSSKTCGFPAKPSI